jgi:hypothetical protein
MDIIGDRHYQAAPTESVTFTEAPGQSLHVGSIVTNLGPLPVTVHGGVHQVVMVTVGFTSVSGGSAVIDVKGSVSGADSSRVRQLATLPARSAPFIVD